MKKIGIIGGGFTGTMTAVQLIRNAAISFEILTICTENTFNRGIAFAPYSKSHLLNVATAKMSALPDDADHFLNWVMKLPEFRDKDRQLISNSFLPRILYGNYLTDIWKETLTIAHEKNIRITMIYATVEELEVNNHFTLTLDSGDKVDVDYCVIATGNHMPRNPAIKSKSFYNSKHYFQNPWQLESVTGIYNKKPILIIGNGLTMVDAVVGLLEQKVHNEIYSISPNGFNILPHRHGGLKYTKLADELPEQLSLFDFVKLVNKHIKSVREFGVSAEPVIDSIRPYTQKLWKRLTDEEKSLFMSRLRHLWGVARHRIPLHIHEKIQKLRIDGILHIQSGKIIDIKEENGTILFEYADSKTKNYKVIEINRVINCTGPETDLSRLEKHFLKKSFLAGHITQDALKLGIKANTDTFEVINADGKEQTGLFTLGSNLKGELWESTAVNELRTQAEKLAAVLLEKIAGV